ncbi:non-ribosomal peptide synthetase [Chitinophaga qingshengii]|uniref:Amino acid adenylation domain-containing protein n=1 Tax=Chitinophaga qingshengii TaxID=1569794 RepID=A0ABR7TFV3_9BACT|nr:non-ribosomal peptide synthetase [Chitinophaga qingshengii]MBC9929273.1 amino acid adenylation domain-containing protein [Chitinophaga qingshengii]
MTISNLILELHQARIQLRLDGEDIALILPAGEGVPDELLEKLRSNKQRLIHWLKQQAAPSGTITGEAAQVSFVATASQRRMWAMEQMNSNGTNNTIYATCCVKGLLNIDCLAEAIHALADRHQILKAVFYEAGEDILVCIDKDTPVEVDYTDINMRPGNDEYLTLQLQVLLARKFDLKKGPLFKVNIWRLKDQYLLVLAIHHIIADGISMEILSDELFQLYYAKLQGLGATLPPVRYQFADYAGWLQEELAVNGESMLDYWRKELGNRPPVLSLPVDFKRSLTGGHTGAVEELVLSRETYDRIQAFARLHHITVSSAMLSLFYVLLSVICNQEDIVIGMPVSGRTQGDWEKLVGLLVNTLPVRNQINHNVSFRETAIAIGQKVILGLSQQLLPFDFILEQLQLPRIPGRNPVFDVMYSYSAAGVQDNLPGLEISAYTLPVVNARVDFALDVVESEEQLKCSFIYDTSLLLADTVQRWVELFGVMSEALLEQPELPLHAVVPTADVLPVMHDYKALPGAVFMQHENRTISYGSLFQTVNAIEKWVSDTAVQERIAIAVLAVREEDKMAACLAAVKKGAAIISLVTTSEITAVIKNLEAGIVTHALLDISLQRRLKGYPLSIPVMWLEEMEKQVEATNNTPLRVLDVPAEYGLPVGETESLLVDIWREVLHHPGIGTKHNFFAAGGDSIKAIRMINAFNTRSGNRLDVLDIFSCQTITSLAELIAMNEGPAQAMKEEWQSAVAEITAISQSVLELPALQDAAIEDVYPMSGIEQGLVFHNLFNTQQAVYHNQLYFAITDDHFEYNRFTAACMLLAAKHDILRTGYQLAAYTLPLHIVYRNNSWTPDIQLINLLHLSGEDQQNYLQRHAAQDRNTPFEVTKPGLWRLRVFQLSAEKYGIFFSFHHAMLDGWSCTSLFTELTDVYYKMATTPALQLPPLKASYKDYVTDQWRIKRDPLQGMFWRRYIQQCERTPLPLGKQNTTAPTAYRVYQCRLDDSLRARLEELVKAEQVSIRDVFLSAFVYLLRFICGYTDNITLGLVTHGRPSLQDSEAVLGCFLNTVPFNINVENRISAIELIKKVSEVGVLLKRYDRVPLKDIIQPEHKGVTSESPLFDMVFNYMDFHVLQSVHPSVEVTAGDLDAVTRKNTLFDFNVFNTGGETRFTIEYTDIYNVEEVERLMKYYFRILGRMSASSVLEPTVVLEEQELKRLIDGIYDTNAIFPSDVSLCDLFETTAKAYPGKTALVFDDQCVTFDFLYQRVLQLAAMLRHQYGVQEGDLVGLIMQPSIEMVLAIQAILRAGGAYVPVDPAFPAARIIYILEDACAKVVLSDEGFSLDNTEDTDIFFSNIPAAHSAIWKRVPEPLKGPMSESLAYVIYTSGSTGLPKGVMVEHAGVVNRIDWMWKYYHFHAGDSILQKTPNIFDVSVWELFMPLCFGCEMVIGPKEIRYDPEMLMRHVSRYAATTVHFVPSVYHLVLEALNKDTSGRLQTLSRIFASGEALLPAVVQKHYEKLPVPLYNLYGPTEASVDVSYYDTGKDDTVVPIGRPIANICLRILDSNLQPVPVGGCGEICIAGIGLARGYINRPELTNDTFVQSPFVRGERIYRTGDLGRWSEDGNILYEGRKDRQVKIRGNRIELGEIENVLLQFPGMEEAAVICRKDKTGADILVAYVVAGFTLDANKLISFLSGKLTAYMIPARFIQLPNLPLTSSGKTDRKMLPEITTEDERVEQPVLIPRTAAEQALVAVIAQVTGQAAISVDANFFSLGGDSIKAIQVVARLRNQHYLLDTKMLFEHPVIADLAALMKTDQREIDQRPVTGAVPLTPVQLYFLHQQRRQPAYFNHAILLQLKKRTNPRQIQSIFEKIRTHHDMLRATFSQTGGKWTQEIMPPDSELCYYFFDYQSKSDALALMEQKAGEIQALDNLQGPLMRIVQFRLPAADFVLFVIHHLVTDGVSWRILLEDVQALLEQERTTSSLTLPLKTHAYRDFAMAVHDYALSDALLCQQAYWQATINEMEGQAGIPADKITGRANLKDLRNCSAQLDSTETDILLRRIGLVPGVSPQDVLIAAFALTVYRCYNNRKVGFMLEGHGREELFPDINISRTVGWFTSIFPVVITVEDETDLAKLVTGVKEKRRSIPDNGMGYGVLKYINGLEILQEQQPAILFNYLGQFDQDIQFSDFTLSSHPVGNRVADDEILAFDLELNAMIIEQSLHFTLYYNSHKYSAATMDHFFTQYSSTLKELIAGCTNMPAVEQFPDAFANSEFSVDELNHLFD